MAIEMSEVCCGKGALSVILDKGLVVFEVFISFSAISISLSLGRGYCGGL